MTEDQTPFDAALDDLLAQLEKKLGPVARAIVSANTAHITEDPEGGEKTAQYLLKKARSSRRGPGRKKAKQSNEELVQAYHAVHGTNDTMEHFKGELSFLTILEYIRRGDKKSG